MWPQGGAFTVLRYIYTNFTLGSINDSLLWKLSFGLLSSLLKVIDRTLGAPIIYFLDKFDKDKYLTLSYFVIYEKNGNQKDTKGSKVNFRCPECASDDALLSDDLKCQVCNSHYEKVQDIPNLVLKNSFKPRSKSFNLTGT